MNRIKYAIDQETGLTWSRYGDKIAVPVPDETKVHEDYIEYTLYRLDAPPVENSSSYFKLEWTDQLPVSIKNYHRKHWGLRPLKGK